MLYFSNNGNLYGEKYWALLQECNVPTLVNFYPSQENPQVPTNVIY